MSDSVVLAPDEQGNGLCTPWTVGRIPDDEPDRGCAAVSISAGRRWWMTDAEARHLRDLLNDWYPRSGTEIPQNAAPEPKPEGFSTAPGARQGAPPATLIAQVVSDFHRGDEFAEEIAERYEFRVAYVLGLVDAYDAGRAAGAAQEREACARIADDPDLWILGHGVRTAGAIAEQIRARGKGGG